MTGRFTVPDNEPAQKSFHEAAQKIREVGTLARAQQRPAAKRSRAPATPQAIPGARFIEVSGDDGALAKELDALATPFMKLERHADLDASEVPAAHPPRA